VKIAGRGDIRKRKTEKERKKAAGIAALQSASLTNGGANLSMMQ
jgi:hypothetical protein